MERYEEDMKAMRKVVKFGGSSLASAEQFRKVGSIIKADESRRYVVPSAPGKRFSADTKVTDLLYQCYRAAKEGGAEFGALLSEIKSRYQEIIDGLELSISLEEDFKVIEENFNIVMDDKLKDIISDAIWDRDNVSDVIMESDRYVITCFED